MKFSGIPFEFHEGERREGVLGDWSEVWRIRIQGNPLALRRSVHRDTLRGGIRGVRQRDYGHIRVERPERGVQLAFHKI